MRMRYSFALTAAAIGVPSFAADLGVKLEVPRLTVAEYHRPYVAMWIEKADQGFAANLAVWYDFKNKEDGGTKWLKDMRQWWRKSGRELQMPVDGLSGATRAPGEHALVLPAARAGLDTLPPGDYAVVVEAAREGGGREVVRVPFKWPARTAQTAGARGEHELGSVTLEIKP